MIHVLISILIIMSTLQSLIVSNVWLFKPYQALSIWSKNLLCIFKFWVFHQTSDAFFYCWEDGIFIKIIKTKIHSWVYSKFLKNNEKNLFRNLNSKGSETSCLIKHVTTIEYCTILYNLFLILWLFFILKYKDMD